MVMRNKRSQQFEPAWWQKALAGQPVPKGLFRSKSKCEGTIEGHRNIALDVRELIRQHVFDQPVGSVFDLTLRFPWLRFMRLDSCSLDLELRTRRTVMVPLVWASCGVIGERMRLECPLCSRRVCTLYHLHGRVGCRTCNSLWYAAQRASSKGRKFQAMRKIRRKLGDYGQLSSAPTKTARHVAAYLCSALRGAGSDKAQAGVLIRCHLFRKSAGSPTADQ
jgi:hypothetical protein